LVEAFVGLGSNMGNKEENIKKALLELVRTEGINVKRVSSLYATQPVGYIQQDWFLNAVAAVDTSLSASALLQRLLAIETALGRKRTVRWGPRVIDLDLLLYDQEIRETESLTLPHPRMYERAFVMVPLTEIAPDLVLPSGQTTREILMGLNRSGVWWYERAPFPLAAGDVRGEESDSSEKN
jgi:2-amino-4-hydroxy-6-hydroxymethyldihydropteridine diphosphokinase